ncbi:MAG TPA: ribonuclease, partial [Candidatus Edwardsbacteria bacterium]|nr:ribonuclease [Candidatus Edwardsbacteria bacterium]
MKAVKKKLFVLDTNVILYDHTCINHFEEHDIVIPIVVLEELDKFKKGSDLINFEAREFIRELDKLAGDQLFTKGVSLGKGKGRLYVEVEDPHSELIYHAFAANKADHRILALADQFCKTLKGRPVIIVSKDINLRMKAKSLGIPAEDYETGKIQHVDKLYAGAQVMEDLEKSIINKFYEEPYSVALDILPKMSPPSPNQYFIFKNNSSSVLCRFNAEKKAMERVVKRQAYGIEPRNAEQTITLDALMQPEIQLVAITGKAGTGKTL